jgi:hypothetical protein
MRVKRIKSDLIHKQAVASDKRRDGSGINTQLSSSTNFRTRQMLSITMEEGQSTTLARFREKKDIRNFLSMAAMNEAFGKD